MTKRKAAELRKKWKDRGDHQPCQHLEQKMERSEGSMETATYYCMTCGKAVLRIYQ